MSECKMTCTMNKKEMNKELENDGIKSVGKVNKIIHEYTTWEFPINDRERYSRDINIGIMNPVGQFLLHTDKAIVIMGEEVSDDMYVSEVLDKIKDLEDKVVIACTNTISNKYPRTLEFVNELEDVYVNNGFRNITYLFVPKNTDNLIRYFILLNEPGLECIKNKQLKKAEAK